MNAFPKVVNDHASLDRLFTAAKSGDLETLTLAKACGVELRVRGKDGASLLHEAAAHGRLDVCEFLMDADIEADVRDDNGNTPLMDATSNMRHPVMRALISRGADADTKNHYGTAVLHYAFLRNDPMGAQILLWAGANPNRLDGNGYRADELMGLTMPDSLRTLIRACAARARLRAQREGVRNSPGREGPRL